MGVKLDDEDDEEKRAEDLSSALETKEKSILVLDDVWKYIDLQKVGIPLRVNGSIKVILITRLIHVCQQMDCSPKNMIRIWPLDSDETWELFLVKLGHQGTPVKLSSEVEKIARSVVKKCGSLPLAINVMARTMKGKLDDVDGWKHKLNKLNKGEMGEEMEEEVLKVLKLSYDNLVDENIQNCFLYSALLPCFTTDDLIMKLVEKGLINGMRSLEEIFAEGRTILGKLEDHSLNLLRGVLEYMSPERVLLLMSYLACYIMKGRHQYAMFKYEKGLPRLQEWTTDLEMVSLKFSEEEIPGDMSPCCPILSSLILCDGNISSIPERFFEHMNALTVLDLSRNESLTALPNSLSMLKNCVYWTIINGHAYVMVYHLRVLPLLPGKLIFNHAKN
ncbi:putative disease resistance protein At4g10780 [Lotus japonicus]|uniref:putative disease resistance protein At4g10780 n=1 Tax=Lotus japonicus TaxID=34305 RepID=UPI00258FC520|nr:putative disease resistance protein At4g10780 [Lotus japonicus]